MKEIARAQKYWAENKYFVLSKSQNIYNDTRKYLKSDKVSLGQVEAMVAKARDLGEDRGQVTNAASHIWGYFKDQASDIEKHAYKNLIRAYENGRIEASDLIGFLKDMLRAYPNDYLEESNIFKEYRK